MYMDRQFDNVHLQTFSDVFNKTTTPLQPYREDIIAIYGVLQ